MIKSLLRLAAFVRMATWRFAQDHGLRTAGSLTYTTLLSLVPIVTVALALMSAFPVFQGLAGVIREFVFNNLMPESVEAIQQYAEEFVANAAQLTTVGVALLVVTALMLLLTIDEAFNGIWRVRYKRPLWQRLLIYWAVITVGPLLIGASLALSSWLVSASAGWTHDIPYADTMRIKFSAVGLTSAALALLYYAMPNRPVRVRDALIGGVAAGIAFEFTKQGFGFYVAHFPTYTVVYGAFAAVPVFLVWIYVSWVVVLAGAVVVATLPEWRQQSLQGPLAAGTQFAYALKVLRILWQARARGESVSMAQLHSALNLSYERLERLLETLAHAGWVRRSAPTGWELQCDLTAITVGDVYRRLVFDAQVVMPQADPEWLRPVQTLSDRVGADEAASMSLAALFEPVAVAQDTKK